MTQDADLERAKQAIGRFHRGQLEAMRGLLDEGVVWRMPNSRPSATDITGVDNVISFCRRGRRRTEGRCRTEVIDILASDRHVVALIRMEAERMGEHVEQRVVNVWRIGADGKICERELFVGERAADAELLSF